MGSEGEQERAETEIPRAGWLSQPRVSEGREGARCLKSSWDREALPAKERAEAESLRWEVWDGC